MQNLTEALSLKITTLISEEECVHEYIGANKRPIKKIFNKVIIDGQAICPRCFTEKNTKELEKQSLEDADRLVKEAKKNMLYKHSQIDDVTILIASISNYQTFCPETAENKQKAIGIIERFMKGEKFNVFIQGKAGTGKSHLGYSILKEINESSLNVSDVRELKENEIDLPVGCLFISIDKMIRLIKDSFSNKESRFTEQYFVEQLSKIDFLVLDDLGAETGAIDSNKVATDFIQRVLYSVLNARQGKVTIVTSNLVSETLFSMYDKKIISRMLRNPEYIIFKTAKDKRQEKVPF